MTTDRRAPDAHLDLLDLDALRGGDPVPAAVSAHVAWCADCASALDALHSVAATLRAAQSDIDIPAPRDAAVLAAARGAAARTRVARRRPGWAAMAAAAVVVLGIAALLRVPLGRPHDAPSVVAAAPAVSQARKAQADGDLDGDGRVTVLDAFALARTGSASPQRIDDVLAMAVSLGNGR